MLERLAKRGPGVRQPVAQGTDISVRVPIEDIHLEARVDVAQEVAERHFMATTEDDHEPPKLELTADHLTQRGLVGVQIAGERDIAEVGGVLEQRREPAAVTRIGGEALEPPANLGRPAGGTRPTPVSQDTLIGGETQQDGMRRLTGRHRASHDVLHARIGAIPGGYECHTVSPPMTVRTQAFACR